MPQRVLCDEGLRVSLEPNEGRLLLTLADGTVTSFVTTTAVLEDALNGAPLQLSSPEGYCRIERFADGVRLEYGLQGGGRKTCSIPVRELESAIAWARGLEEA